MFPVIYIEPKTLLSIVNQKVTIMRVKPPTREEIDLQFCLAAIESFIYNKF